MIARIIPILKLPPKHTYFDYLVTKEMETILKPGNLVKIPFRAKTIHGVVLNIDKNCNSNTAKLKNITCLEMENILFPRQTLDLISTLGNYYINSWATVVHCVWTKIPTKISTQQRQIKGIPDLTKLAIKLHSLKTHIDEESQIIIPDNAELKFSTILQIIAQNIKNEKQVIICSPTIYGAKNIFEFLKRDYEDIICLIHGKISPSKYWRNFNDISQGQKKLIIGTKAALFSPTSNLGALIMEKYHSVDYKQTEQNPRYDGRWAAQKLSQLAKIPFYAFSLCPQAKDASGKLKTTHLSSSSKSPIVLIDIKNEIYNGNYTPLSLPLQSHLTKLLAQKENIFCLINQKGYSSAIICQDCKYIFQCPQCKTTLRSNQEQTYCSQCQKKFPLQRFCPKCKKIRIQYPGAGIEQVKNFFQLQFPFLKINSIDKENPGSSSDFKNCQILLGTQFVLSNYEYLLARYFKNFAVLSIDGILFVPDYTAGQRAFNLLKQMEFLANLSANPLYVQTNFYNHSIFLNFSQHQEKNFIQSELANRKLFRYPPFAKIITITLKTANPKYLEKQTHQMIQQIKQTPLFATNLEILPPTITQEKGKFFKKTIVLKIFSPKHLPAIREEIRQIISPNELIDVDPLWW